ncbi:MAG: hypothetical protein FJ297_05990 [Planctomycetes bacterium]|nr:hypothetical protein [Planctomycetota bacterium]
MRKANRVNGTRRRGGGFPWSAGLAIVAVVATGASAEDYFLAIGGGYAPSSNQVSLEKNVLLFERLIHEEYPGGAPTDVFFSDGDDASRDLQFEGPRTDVPEVNRLLAEVFLQTRNLDYAYRTNAVPSVRGGATRENITRWFDERAAKLGDGDRLFIYATAHGGAGPDKQRPTNTKLMLWNHQQFTVEEFVGLLDKVPPRVRVVLIMAQCYAGGFADVVFQSGKADQGATEADRCGFFATVHDRPAAGCTPDITEENYREYSTYFWEAIRGRTRGGEPIARPDYDGDHIVSFDEAHAYTQLVSSTIDIPIKTSDAFLRSASKLGDAEHADLLNADAPFDQLASIAAPWDRAVLDGLSRELEVTAPARGEAARALAKSIEEDRKKKDQEIRGKTGARDGAAGEIRRDLTNTWPELNNVWRPEVQVLLTAQADDVVKVVRDHPRFTRLRDLNAELDQLQKQKGDLDCRFAKTQRLLRTLDNVALAANLSKVAPSERQARYARLVQSEHAAFGAKAAEKAANRASP